MTDSEILEVLKQTEDDSCHFDKYFYAKIIRQLKSERDMARREADSLVKALAYGVRELR